MGTELGQERTTNEWNCSIPAWGTQWRSWLRHCATSRKVAGPIPSGSHWNFSLTYSFRPHYGPEVNPAPNRNAYQEYLLYGKGGRCLRLTNLLPSCATVMEYRNLNLLEPSGPVHASYGIALPLCICTWVDEQPFVFYGILSSELGSVHVCTDHVAGEDKETLWSIIFLHRGCDESEVVSAHNLKAWGGEQTYSPTHS